MRIVVQKYGGSSVAGAEKIRRVARKVKARRDEGGFELLIEHECDHRCFVSILGGAKT